MMCESDPMTRDHFRWPEKPATDQQAHTGCRTILPMPSGIGWQSNGAIQSESDGRKVRVWRGSHTELLAVFTRD
jgi:hypothetical protein